MSTPFYEYDHLVTLEETNAVGNVYFVNHLRWQGRCRELFLRDHAPDVLRRLGQDLDLITVRCSCDYLGEARAFDRVKVRMFLSGAAQNRVTFRFEYWIADGEDDRLIARGEQAVACMTRTTTGLTPSPLPDSFRRALNTYGETAAREVMA